MVCFHRFSKAHPLPLKRGWKRLCNVSQKPDGSARKQCNWQHRDICTSSGPLRHFSKVAQEKFCRLLGDICMPQAHMLLLLLIHSFSSLSKGSLASTKTLMKIKCYVKITFLATSSGWEDSSISWSAGCKWLLLSHFCEEIQSKHI